MSYLQSIILGLVQGLGEFLPISSSAHLVIAPWALGFVDPGLTYDVALHFGTLFAVLAFFWRDWVQLGTGTLEYLRAHDVAHKQKYRLEFQTLIFIVLATLPAALIGKLLDQYAEEAFRAPLLVAFNMVLMGVILLFADRKGGENRKGLAALDLKSSLIIGFAQVLALIPGVSRSGVTITAALFLGYRRDTAARFSFLLSTPITFGACLLKSHFFTQVPTDGPALVGIAISALTGFLSIKYIMRFVQQQSYRIFCYYRFLFGLAVVLLYFTKS